MAPILASILVGVGVKLVAVAARKILETATAGEARPAESFLALLKSRSPEAAAGAGGFAAVKSEVAPAGSAPAHGAPLPSDLSGRLAADERWRTLALDLQRERSLPALTVVAGRESTEHLAP